MPAGANLYDNEFLATAGLFQSDSALIEKTESFLATKSPTHEQRHPTTPCKQVRFHGMVQVSEIVHIKDMGDEIRDIWYSTREFVAIRESNYEDLSLILSGKVLEGNDYTMRGLETRTQAGYERRKRNKVHGWMAVLEEQARQDRDAICDPESMAQIYQLETEHCREDALEQGMMDEEDARV
mmetsp:Transcript_33349/g.76827  ORF Transcript_33349/g.76827 Transcript_33349/m.76827 type:complete len:182 (+) Transcript_33349:33-578(+)